PSDGTGFDSFGLTVQVSGDTAIIGSFLAAYVFRRSGNSWTQLEEFKTPGGFADLAIQGDTVLVRGGGINGAVAVHDVGGGTATATATVTVSTATAALTVIPATLPDVSAGSPYGSPAFAASGGAGSGYTFHVSGILPPGLGFDPGTAQL